MHPPFSAPLPRPPPAPPLSLPHPLVPQTVGEGNSDYASAQTFQDLGLSPELLKGLFSEMRFERPSAIQAVTLPMILTGPPFRNLVAQARFWWLGPCNGGGGSSGGGRRVVEG